MTLIFLTGCSKENSAAQAVQSESLESDTAVIVFGPSLTEMFYISGTWDRLAGVDRFSIWPSQASELAVIGDFLAPSLEMITALGATSIHVVGRNQSLLDLAERLDIPCYQYSFDRLDDVYESCNRIENLYQEADFTGFRDEIEVTLDSLSVLFSYDPPEVMIVVYLKGDGAISLAGMDTFYFDILQGMGCALAAPEAGSYPAVSVEGILAIAPDRVIILDPYNTGETALDAWRSNGLDDSNVTVLSGDHVLIPGARLQELIIGIAQCLN
ncbi:MAG: ABC transporter substrate-binding protein [Candidatus Sabulitectum sp.]|nr:ABC transporter substrate-binding protein [Candidatus Sabulitectum sp.]